MNDLTILCDKLTVKAKFRHKQFSSQNTKKKLSLVCIPFNDGINDEDTDDDDDGEDDDVENDGKDDGDNDDDDDETGWQPLDPLTD